MNIAIITDTYFPDINGVTSSIYTLAMALQKRGHRVYIFATSEKSSTAIRKVNKNPAVYRIPSIPMVLVRPYRTTMPYSVRLMQILKRLRIDIIHTQTEFSMGFVGLSSATTLHLPIIHTYHTMLADYTHYILNGKVTKIITPEMAEWYSRRFCNLPTALIVPTEKVKNSLESYGVQKPIFVIPSGIDLSPFRREKYADAEITTLRSKYGLLPSHKVILSLGRIAKEKSIDMIVEEMPFVVEKIPEARLLIIGDGPVLQELKELAASVHATPYVIFAGSAPYSEIGKYYQLGDVFISCSTSETQGLTYYEAMAAGLPVVARRDDAGNVLFHDGENSRLFDDEADIPSIMEELFSDEDALKRYREHAKESVATFSSETFASRVEDAYKSAIDRYILEKESRKVTLRQIPKPRKLRYTKLVMRRPESDNAFISPETEDIFDAIDVLNLRSKGAELRNDVKGRTRKAYNYMKFFGRRQIKKIKKAIDSVMD